MFVCVLGGRVFLTCSGYRALVDRRAAKHPVLRCPGLLFKDPPERSELVTVAGSPLGSQRIPRNGQSSCPSRVPRWLSVLTPSLLDLELS